MSGRVIVGLSGGVDSSVAALLLLEQGWQVEGLFMKNWEEDDDADYCNAAEDLADAQAVATQLGIPLHKVNFATEYWDRVFAYFLDEYSAGRTPNPDVLCNREIKFKAFLDYALELGADKIATGHYAGVDCTDDRCRLIRAVDGNKDQTYFLYMLGQRALRHTLFPLNGIIAKAEVRGMAERAGFPNHKKKDSTGVCFIGERRFREFLSRYLPANPGAIRTEDGRCLGEHQGLMYYTLGQRQGLGIGGVANAPDEPWYVVGKDLQSNVLLVAQGHDHPLLYRSDLTAHQLHWVNRPPTSPAQLMARCRHRQPLQACLADIDGDTLKLTFDRAQRAITPGQSVVLYDADTCLGGGIID